MISSPPTSAWQLYDLNMPGVRLHYYVLAGTLSQALTIAVDDTITVENKEMMIVSNVTTRWLERAPERTAELIAAEKEGLFDYDDEDGWVPVER